jgi:hypothetical protein
MKMGNKASSSNKMHHPLVLCMISILILLVTIDIYLSILSPRSCAFFSIAPHGVDSSHESSQTNEQQSPIETKTFNELINYQPRGGQAGITFGDIKALEDTDDAGDAAWAKLSTPTGGYLFLTSNETNSPREPWGVSMFHGFHCLQMLRDTIRELEGQVNQSSSTQRDGQHHQHSDDGTLLTSTHYKHCFAYIAQVSIPFPA